MKHIYLIAITLFVISCNNTPSVTPVASPVQPGDSITKKPSFFPVTSYINGQLHELDSLPVTPLLVITENNKTDSIWIKREQIRSYLQPFTTPLIDSTNLTAYFTETSFNDRTLNCITFTYDPKVSLPDTLAIRNWTVYIDPDKGTVVKIYLVKMITNNEKKIMQQLTWKSGKLAIINSVLLNPDGTSKLLKEEKVIWDLNGE